MISVRLLLCCFANSVNTMSIGNAQIRAKAADGPKTVCSEGKKTVLHTFSNSKMSVKE